MLEVNKKLCTGCSACYTICPTQCIKMQENDEGFLFPVTNVKRCIGCDACNKVCPLDKEYVCTSEAYSVVNKSTIPHQSSSTGIAYQISKTIIAEGGVVFGAIFNKECEVIHQEISNFDELKWTQGSKYVQSNMQDTFKSVKNALCKNKNVVFIGTPCQCVGLREFLGENTENLYMIDFICHGVPSPKVWRYYLEYIKNANALGRIMKINFRDKKCGWSNYGIRITGEKNEYFALKTDDLYEKAFSRNITLRKSCYFCKFKGDNRCSDITLGDFWGGNKYSSIFDCKGTSIVSIHTLHGKELLDKISDNFSYERVDLSEYFKYHNNAMINSVKLTNVRSKFFKKFADSPKKIEAHLSKHIKKTNLSLKLIRLKGKLVRGRRKILRMLRFTK